MVGPQEPEGSSRLAIDREVFVVLLDDPHIQHALRRLDPEHLDGHPYRRRDNPSPEPSGRRSIAPSAALSPDLVRALT
jgi:hypothetical protein